MGNSGRRLGRTTAEVEEWEPDAFGSDRSIFKVDKISAATYSEKPTEGN